MGRLGERRKGGRRWLAVAIGVVALSACLATTASGIRLRAGDILIVGDGQVLPKSLPKDHYVPVRLRIHGRLTTVSGALPPVLERMKFEFEREGEIQTTGLPVCQSADLEATTVPQARKLCPGAIIGTGTGKAIVKFPEQPPIDVSSPLTFFNGPNGNGRWTVFLHAYNTVPVPATILFKITIEKIDNGRFGYLVESEIPKISGGYGIPVAAKLDLGRKWTFAGKRYSYLNRSCATGRIQANGQFSFKDGTVVSGSFLKRCSVRP